MDWYQLNANDVLKKLNSATQGLLHDEVEKRFSEYGPNKFVIEEKTSRLQIVLHQFTSPLIYVLLIASVVSVFLREYIDTGVIMAVVILNAIIGYIQEYKAEESISALKKLVVPKARVVRDGREQEINSEDLVPGDIVILSSGSKIPADIRLFKAIELRTDEALLTGESLPSNKSTSALKEKNLTAGDQKNMAFMGTIVVSGRARGIVVETGHRTALGRIAKEVREIRSIKTPLQEKFHKFAKFIGLFTLGFSTILLAAGVLLGEELSEMFMVAVATAVSVIPEGLPIAVTVAMAIGVSRMAERNSIIRKLPAVETLGSTTIICSDKTGTLTKNEMTVRLIYDGTHTFEVTGGGYDPDGEILHENLPVTADNKKDLLNTLRIGLLCNESDIYEINGQYKVDGDPTEGALIVSAIKAGLNHEAESGEYPQIAMIPFESERGYMATLHNHRGKKVIYVKGAPEKLIDMCAESMTGEEMNSANHYSHGFAKEGLRVIALAYKETAGDKETLTHEDIKSGLVYAGLQGMMDPPREESLRAVQDCKKAGIRTVMVTGDHSVTALAISRKLGIGEDTSEVLTGKEIETLSDDDLFNKSSDISIFARVSPEHKLRIVQQFVRKGEIVAVTGDGVNDAPALKAAHIGVAMAAAGTDVAKEASDMIVTDNNFASIVSAVEEGRVVYDNIEKVTLFLVSCGLGELLAIFTTLLLGLPIPYIPAQILWLNLVTNGFQDVALAFEPAEQDVIKRPPRNPRERIMSKLIVQRTLLMGFILAAGTFYMFNSCLKAGVPLEKARTVALTTMVFFQFYQAFNCRSSTQSIFKMSFLTNPFLFFSMIAAFFAQMAVIYVPALQWIFRTVPLDLNEWLRIIIITTTIVIAVEIDKSVRRGKTTGG